MDINRRTAVIVTVTGLLIVSGLTLVLWPSKTRSGLAFQEVPPSEVEVTGVIRDFRREHPDFAPSVPEGQGHYAGTVLSMLDGSQHPVFAPDGYKVDAEWRDVQGRPMAPHLYLPASAASSLAIPVVVDSGGPSDGVLDSWDSSVGPYGGANIGPAPTFAAGSAMPVVTVPTTLAELPSEGALSFVGGEMTGDHRCDTLFVNQLVRVGGATRIFCKGAMTIETDCQIELLPGASLTLYLGGGGIIRNWSGINANTSKPGRMRIYNVGIDVLALRNHAQLYARVVSPNAPLDIDNHAEFFGTFVGSTIIFKNHGSFHLDVGPMTDACGNLIDDTAGTAGVAGSGGITSGETFGQWFRDVLGTNTAMHHTITMSRNAEGVFEYVSDAFHPIDGRLYGDEDEAHNNYFTYEIAGRFVAGDCTGQFVEFEGGDGAWLFVDGQLVMDLGGFGAPTSQFVDVDRLGLTAGTEHGVCLLYAQRSASSSTFRLRTNLVIETDSVVPMITSPYD